MTDMCDRYSARLLDVGAAMQDMKGPNAYIVMAYTVMAHRVMAYEVMA